MLIKKKVDLMQNKGRGNQLYCHWLLKILHCHDGDPNPRPWDAQANPPNRLPILLTFFDNVGPPNVRPSSM